MLDVEFKNEVKFKACGKGDLVRKGLCDEILASSEQKMNYKEYMNEIFAGLIWLG